MQRPGDAVINSDLPVDPEVGICAVCPFLESKIRNCADVVSVKCCGSEEPKSPIQWHNECIDRPEQCGYYMENEAGQLGNTLSYLLD